MGSLVIAIVSDFVCFVMKSIVGYQALKQVVGAVFMSPQLAAETVVLAGSIHMYNQKRT